MKVKTPFYKDYKYSIGLLNQLVVTDFKLRYQGSVLGYSWSLLKPLFMFVILYVVFGVILGVDDGIPNFPIYLLLGIVLWGFFAELTQQSLGSIVARGDLIRKIRIPRWLIILSTSISALINLALNLVVVLAFAVFSGMDFSFSSLLLPLYLIEIYLFGLGISLIIAPLFVKYRDVGYIWELVIQAGFYATPILYPLQLVTNVTLQKIMLLNPIAQAIQGARSVFVTPKTITISEVFSSPFIILMPLSIIVAILIFGFLYFKKEAKNFAENL